MDHRLNLIKILLENKAKRIRFEKDSESVQELFRKLESNIFDKSDSGRGKNAEHLARMVHAVRSLHVAHSSDLLPRFIADFSELSKKGTSANGDDAIEYYIDSKTGDMKAKRIDVKGINTTLSQRADEKQREVMGLTDSFYQLDKRIGEVVGNIKVGTLPKSSKEAVSQVKKVARSESEKEYKELVKTIDSNFQSGKINPAQLRGFIVDKFKLNTPEVAWSLMPSGPKKFILGPSTEEGQRKLPVIVPGKTIEHTIKGTQIFADPTVPYSPIYRNITISSDDNPKKRSIRARPEILVRMGDLSAQDRQKGLEAVSKQKGQEELQFANIDQNMLETLRSHIKDNELLGKLQNHLGGFVRDK